MDRLVEVSGRTIVDVGCGDGTLARALRERGADVVAIEPEPEQAERNEHELACDGIRFYRAGAEDIPLSDSCADGVIFSKSLHHVPIELMNTAIDEAIRILRPDGFLYILEPEVRGSYTELVKPFHDETIERAAAQDVVANRAESAFSESGEYSFYYNSYYDDFEEFIETVVSRRYNDIRREQVDTDDIRRMFHAGRRDERFVFDQPMCLNLLRNPKPDCR